MEWRCEFSDCLKEAVLLCSCDKIHCKHHMKAHLQERPKHITKTLKIPAPLRHQSTFRSLYISLKKGYMKKLSDLSADRAERIGELYNEIMKINREITEEARHLTKKFTFVQNFFMKLGQEQALFKNSSNPFTLSFIDFYETNEHKLSRLKVDSFFNSYLFSGHMHSSVLKYACSFNNIESCLSIYDEKAKMAEIPYDNFNDSSRALYLGGSKIMITGGNIEGNLASVISLSTMEIEKISPLSIDRKWHSMAFIDNMPAVIGGCRYNNTLELLDIVEVLHDGHWKVLKALKTPRSLCASSWFHDKTYVVGGISGNKAGKYTFTDTIEMWNQGKWKTLKIRIQEPLHSVGFVVLNQYNWLVLGGNDGYEDRNTVSHVCGNEVKQVGELEFPASFPHNFWIKWHQGLCSFDKNRKSVNFLL